MNTAEAIAEKLGQVQYRLTDYSRPLMRLELIKFSFRGERPKEILPYVSKKQMTLFNYIECKICKRLGAQRKMCNKLLISMFNVLGARVCLKKKVPFLKQNFTK